MPPYFKRSLWSYLCFLWVKYIYAIRLRRLPGTGFFKLVKLSMPTRFVIGCTSLVQIVQPHSAYPTSTAQEICRSSKNSYMADYFLLCGLNKMPLLLFREVPWLPNLNRTPPWLRFALHTKEVHSIWTKSFEFFLLFFFVFVLFLLCCLVLRTFYVFSF